MNSDFAMCVDAFNWESESQKEGYLSMVHSARMVGLNPEIPINPYFAFLIQKNVEAAEWWRNVLVEQVKPLEKEIMDLKQEVARLKENQDYCLFALKALTSTIKAEGRAYGENHNRENVSTT